MIYTILHDPCVGCEYEEAEYTFGQQSAAVLTHGYLGVHLKLSRGATRLPAELGQPAVLAVILLLTECPLPVQVAAVASVSVEASGASGWAA